MPLLLLELQNRLFSILKELHKISFVWKYGADMLNSFLVMPAKNLGILQRMYGSLTILPPSCFEVLWTSMSSFKLHVQNRKFSPVFSSTSFLKFYIQLYFILFLSLSESVANEAECKQWRHKRLAYTCSSGVTEKQNEYSFSLHFILKRSRRSSLLSRWIHSCESRPVQRQDTDCPLANAGRFPALNIDILRWLRS